MLEVGATVGGKFRIERILGQGGMGVVAIATHLQLDQQVALKVLHDATVDDAEAVERFLREARASARLRSEHVCKVSDVGQLDSGAPYIVMELLEGSDLQGVLAHCPLPVAMAVEYVLQACVAVAEAHALGIVHRDLKPGNLFLTKRLDGSPLIKVLDFGIAKAPSASEFNITRTSTIMGSPGYMSPEQLRSTRDVDARSDIWALGVILYELVSGRLPFQASSITELAVKVVMDPPDPLAVGTPAFAAIVYRCLEKDADRRYPTVAALAADLAALGGESARRTAMLIATLTTGGRTAPGAAAAAMAGDGRAATAATVGPATAATVGPASALPRPPAPTGGGHAATIDTAGSLPRPPATDAEAAAVAGRLPPGPVRSTTLETAAAQSTGTPGTPARPAPARRRLALLFGGLALAALVALGAAVAVVAIGRDRHRGPARHHAPLAGELGDAGTATALAPADAAASPAAVDAEPEAAANLPELRAKLRTLAASHDWYAVLQLADLDHDDPEIAGIVGDAKQQYVGQQERAIDAQVRQGQCARARELADAARQVVPDDTTLEARARACKPHAAAPPAPPPTIEDANQALAAGDYPKAFELADKLARKDPDDLAATRVAALAACGMKNVDKATSYAAKLRGADRKAARTLCRKNNIEIDAGPGEGKPSGPGEDAAPEDALAEAQRAANQGEWAKALSLVETVLQRTPRHVPALILGATAACHLKKDQEARAMLKHIPLLRQRTPRQACAQEGVFL